MIRTLPFLAAALLTSAMLVGTNAAPAYAQGPAYRAVPVAPVQTASNVIVGDTMWHCAPDGCTAATANGRPAIVCEMAAKKVGKLTSFAVGTTSFDAEALAKCNAKARS